MFRVCVNLDSGNWHSISSSVVTRYLVAAGQAKPNCLYINRRIDFTRREAVGQLTRSHRFPQNWAKTRNTVEFARGYIRKLRVNFR